MALPQFACATGSGCGNYARGAAAKRARSPHGVRLVADPGTTAMDGIVLLNLNTVLEVAGRRISDTARSGTSTASNRFDVYRDLNAVSGAGTGAARIYVEASGAIALRSTRPATSTTASAGRQ